VTKARGGRRKVCIVPHERLLRRYAATTREGHGMRFAIVGLGRMGLSLGKLAVKQGHQVVGCPATRRARPATTAA
jgi:phosphoglycerate dehydrogenase-like enzyme